jgi:glycosyltransferase involved in cell wall biosynthesis
VIVPDRPEAFERHARTAPPPLRFLSVATEWASGKGGVTTFNRELCKALARQGHQVTCLVPRATTTESNDAKNVGISLAVPPCAVGLEGLFVFDPKLGEFDFIIGHGRVTGRAAEVQQYQRPSSQRIHFVHVSPQRIDWFKPGGDATRKAEDRQREEGELARTATHAFAVGPLLRDDYAAYLHPHGTPVHEFRPGLFDADAAGDPPALARCLILGRAEDEALKGLDIAARAIGVLARDGVAVELVVRGAPANDGAALRTRLKECAGNTELDIIVQEYTADTESLRLDLLRASLVLMPSRSEGFGLSALEAISADVPVLVSRKSGLARLLATLAPEASKDVVIPVTENLETDCAAWAAAIRRMLSDRSAAFKRARLLRAALQPHLTWDDAAAALVRVVSANMSPGPGTPDGRMLAPEISLEYDAQLNRARDLLRAYDPQSALGVCRDIEGRAWARLADPQRSTLQQRKGAAFAMLGQLPDAAACFLESLRWDPNGVQALRCAAVAHLVSGNTGTARELVDSGLRLAPEDPDLNALLVDLCSEGVVEGVAASVPSSVRDHWTVQLSLGRHAASHDDLARAEDHVVRADAAGPRPEVQRVLAIVLTRRATSRGLGADLHEDERQKVERAISLLTGAFEVVRHGTATLLKAEILASRAYARHLAGDLPGAEDDAELACSIAPASVEALRERAILAIAAANPTRLRQTASRLAAVGIPEAPIFVVEALRIEGQHAEAIRAATSIDRAPLPAGAQRRLDILLGHLHAQAKNYDAAVAKAEEALAADPNDISLIAQAALVAREAGADERANQLLTEALSRVTVETSVTHLHVLAIELFTWRRWAEAAAVLSRLADTKRDTTMTLRLLRCHEHLGDLCTCLAICRSVRETRGVVPQVAALESYVYEEIGALQQAGDLCTQALEVAPDDDELLLRRALVAFRRGDAALGTAALERLMPRAHHHLERGVHVVRLFQRFERWRDALKVAHRIRRHHYNDAHAHSLYVDAFLSRDDELLGGADESVTLDSALALRGPSGNVRWWTFEDDGVAEVARGEIGATSAFARALLGRAVGESVQSSGEPQTVTEIVHKYGHAFRESLSLAATVFAGSSGIEQVNVASPSPEDAGFRRTLDAVEASGKQSARISEEYSMGRITLGAAALRSRASVVEVLLEFSRSSDIGVRVATGSFIERAETKAALSTSPRLVMDLTVAVVLHALRLGGTVIRRFGKLLVGQSCIDELREMLSERVRPQAQRGFMTLGYRAGQFFRTDVSPEEVQRGADFVRELLSWIDEHAEVVPCTRALSMPRAERTSMARAIGLSSVDALLISSEPARVLYSDDLFLRMLAKNGGTHGVATQHVFLACAEAGLMDARQFAEATVALACANYRHTWIDETALAVAAEKDGWAGSGAFRVVASLLGEANSDVASATRIAAAFLFRLWEQGLSAIRRDDLAVLILTALTTRRARAMTLSQLLGAVGVRGRVSPRMASDIASFVSAWDRSNAVRGP